MLRMKYPVQLKIGKFYNPRVIYVYRTSGFYIFETRTEPAIYVFYNGFIWIILTRICMYSTHSNICLSSLFLQPFEY